MPDLKAETFMPAIGAAYDQITELIRTLPLSLDETHRLTMALAVRCLGTVGMVAAIKRGEEDCPDIIASVREGAELTIAFIEREKMRAENSGSVNVNG